MRLPSALLRDTATLEAFVGENAYGPVGVDSVELACRIVPAKRTRRSGDREAVECVAVAYARCETEIPVGSTLTVGDVAYTVLDVAARPGLTGPMFQELSLGRSEPGASSVFGREEPGT